jgi:hypothetical protein
MDAHLRWLYGPHWPDVVLVLDTVRYGDPRTLGRVAAVDDEGPRAAALAAAYEQHLQWAREAGEPTERHVEYATVAAVDACPSHVPHSVALHVRRVAKWCVAAAALGRRHPLCAGVGDAPPVRLAQ